MDAHLRGARSFLELLEVHRRVEREALAVEAKRLGIALGDGEVASADDLADGPAAGLLARLRESGLAPAGAAEHSTYRLLIGVLLDNPDEVRALRAHTIGPLEQYDALHDTELVVTLETFLSHHGSTTDTADAMRLHRHTVGYRLTRVHEVSGLSPYESEGRERLSLGLKAKRILAADASRAAPRGWRASEPPAPAET